MLGIIWGTTFRTIHVEDASAKTAAIASTRDLVATYEAQVVRALREIDQTLKVVQYAAETKGAKPALADLQQRALLPPNLLFVISLTDARGEIVASTDAAHPVSVTPQASFQHLRDLPLTSRQELSVSEPYRDSNTGEWHLQFSRRVNAPDGAFGGAVTMGVDAAYFVSGYERAKLGEHGVLGCWAPTVFFVHNAREMMSAPGILSTIPLW